jgi:hypothetical protein
LAALRLQRKFRQRRAYALGALLRERLKVTHIEVKNCGCQDAIGVYERGGRDENENLFFVKESTSSMSDIIHVIKQMVANAQSSKTKRGARKSDPHIKERLWVLVRVNTNTGVTNALYFHEGESAVAAAYPTATGTYSYTEYY